MTDETSPADWMPAACTLPSAEQPLRRAEFDALFRLAVRDAERIGPQQLRMTFGGAADLEETVRELADRESECCSFFTFTVGGGDTVQLDIEVPPGHVDVLDALAARALAARAAR